MHRVSRKKGFIVAIGLGLLAAIVILPITTHGQGLDARAVFLEQRIREPLLFPQYPDAIRLANSAVEFSGLWQIETVVGSGVGLFSSMAIDASGRPHISYCSDYLYNWYLNYAYYDGQSWHIETVDSTCYKSSLALDSAGRPHISYGEWVLKYAHYDGSTWHIETIDNFVGQYGGQPSLALDSADHPHIAYYDAEELDLIYAYHDGFVWHIATVDSAGATGVAPSIALDSAGRPHISYHTYTQGLRYAHYDGQRWIIQAVDSMADTSSSLALDNSRYPHVSYCTLSGYLRYARYNGSNWQIETIDVAKNAAFSRSSLSLDRSGYPHVIHVPGDPYNDLDYLYKDNTGWRIQTVDSNLGVNGYGFLALDPSGQPHIAFTTNRSLRYAMPKASNTTSLIFASYRDMNYEIYTARGDGSYPVRRTNNVVIDTTPDYNRGAAMVAFVSNRDRNPEIYRMNANGSGQARLTWNNADDYRPVWSPDSSKITFYSYRDGNAEIYVMNSDGSNQVRLTSNLAWDGHPTWSPDGSMIAFVSARSGTHELWTMNADGSHQRQLSFGLGSAAYPDWAPDGTRIAFNYDANSDGWLDVAMIAADGSGLSYPLGLSPSSYDYLAPVWAPYGENLAVTQVQWVQHQGNWYWMSARIYGVDLSHGWTYLLLDTSYDWWPDWESIDTTPPTCWLSAPAWSNTITFTVTWSASDVGPAGVRSYDVQYRDGDTGSWVDWFSDTSQTGSVFTGEYGHTYCFRCRARDYVYNLGPYTGGDACTRVYRYALSGHVVGNREQPIAVASVQATPSAMNIASSQSDGSFVLYFNRDGYYAIQAFHHNFGSLPPMNDVLVTDTYTATVFYLPPADDQVTDGGFEAGNLAAWTTAGEITPTLISSAHTGSFALMFGGPISPTLHGSGPWRSVAEQEIIMSSVLESSTLSLLYQVIGGEPLSDTCRISLIGATEMVTYTLPITPGGWTHQWWDIAAMEGPTLTLRVEWYQRSQGASVIIDEISLGSALRGSYPIYMPVVLRKRL